jgi:hypothetical protein
MASVFLPDAVTVVMRDVAATYPIPAQVEPTAAGGDVVWITSDSWSRAGIRIDGALPPAEQIADVADQIADWLVESLPGAGCPAVWPVCPLHPGSHPMQTRVVDAVAVWTCPVSGDTVAAVGSLPMAVGEA